MDDQTLTALIEHLVDEPAIENDRPRAIAYVARCERGVANDFGFLYPTAGGSGAYYLPKSDEALEIVWDYFSNLEPAPERMAFVLRIDFRQDSVRLKTFYDDDAKPWFVPLGEEGRLEALADGLSTGGANDPRDHLT